MEPGKFPLLRDMSLPLVGGTRFSHRDAGGGRGEGEEKGLQTGACGNLLWAKEEISVEEKRGVATLL